MNHNSELKLKKNMAKTIQLGRWMKVQNPIQLLDSFEIFDKEKIVKRIQKCGMRKKNEVARVWPTAGASYQNDQVFETQSAGTWCGGNRSHKKENWWTKTIKCSAISSKRENDIGKETKPKWILKPQEM